MAPLSLMAKMTALGRADSPCPPAPVDERVYYFTVLECLMMKTVVNFLKREDGPTAVEYAVMLALIIVVCIAAITTLGGNANTTFSSVGNSIGTAS